MVHEFPFQYLAEKIHFFRNTIQDSMREVYKEIGKNRTLQEMYPSLSSPAVQDIIYQRIINKILDDDQDARNHFRENFIVTTLQRDEVLSRYVRKSLDEIKSWNPNNELVEAHFLKIMAADTKTESVRTQIVPITGYYGEKTIDRVVANQWDKYGPLFKRPDGAIAPQKDIEILGILNMSGWGDIGLGEISSPDQLIYKVISRVKRSERELKKLLDWGYGIRKFKDYPFDSIAATIVVPDLNQKKKLNGAEIYQFKDFAKNISDKCYDDNVNTEKQNKESEIKKLLIGKYNEANYKEVLAQIEKTMAKVEIERKRSKNPSSYRISSDDRERELQGYRLKHIIEGNNKIETLIQTHFLNEVYEGKDIGHTSFYFAMREWVRKMQLINPALGYANTNPKITELPSIDYLDAMLFTWFLPAFDIKNRLAA